MTANDRPAGNSKAVDGRTVQTDSQPRIYRIPSAFGDWTVEFTAFGLKTLRFPPKKPAPTRLPILCDQERRQGRTVRTGLSNVLSGKPATLPWNAFDLSGLTDFQQRVLAALYAVPFGAVVTYGELAARIGRAKSARAVGGVCGANPIPIFIPCHRVVAADGLGGFGPGPTWKIRLLRFEGVVGAI